MRRSRAPDQHSVATGENETRVTASGLVEHKAATILNPNHALWGLQRAPEDLAPGSRIRHPDCAAPCTGTVDPFAGGDPNALLLEWSITRTPVWREEPRVVDGYMSVPDRPGHGMEFSDAALDKYLVK